MSNCPVCGLIQGMHGSIMPGCMCTITSKTVYTAQIIEESGELVLPLHYDVVDRLGWNIGDVLTWNVKKDGSIVIQKKQKKKE